MKIFPIRQAVVKRRETIKATQGHILQSILGVEKLMRDRRVSREVMELAADARIHLLKAGNMLKEARRQCEGVRVVKGD